MNLSIAPLRPASLTESHAGLPPEPLVPGLPGPHDAGTLRIGPPPARGSDAERVELDHVRRVAAARTPEGDAWARRLNSEGATKVWWQMLDRYRAGASTIDGARAAALLSTTMAFNAVATQALKAAYRRARPFEVDPTIPALVHPHDRSYPSGHTSNAYAAARVFAHLDHRLAAEAYDLAKQVGESRVYAGAHFASDVVAGARVGTAVADLVMSGASTSEIARAINAEVKRLPDGAATAAA